VMFKKLLLLSLMLGIGAAAEAQVFNQWPSQSSSFNTLIAPATPAKQAVKASAGVVTSITCYNILATPVYINMFDALSGSITLGTTSANYKFMCPGNTAGAGFVIAFHWAINFTTGITYSVSSGIGLTDNTSTSANSVIVNVGYN